MFSKPTVISGSATNIASRIGSLTVRLRNARGIRLTRERSYDNSANGLRRRDSVQRVQMLALQNETSNSDDYFLYSYSSV